MLNQTKGYMHLVAQRPKVQNARYRSYKIFQQGNEAAVELGVSTLLHFDDDTLAGNTSHAGQAEKGTLTLFLPLVGGVNLSTSHDEKLLEPGMLMVLPAAEKSVYTVSNPYDIELVNYLKIVLKTPSAGLPHRIVFDLESTKNTLCPLWNGPGARIHLGRFGGREEGEYVLQHEQNILLAFVVLGAFEVQNRLLQDRDAVSLKGAEVVEFEALSEGAILMLLEFGQLE